MCSLLIWASTENVGREKQWLQFERGDVIDINDDDNFYWGDAVSGPNALGLWEVVVIEGAPAQDFQGLIIGEQAPANPNTKYRIRTSNLDIDKIENEKKKKKEEKLTKVTANYAFSCIKQKQPFVDETVIGQEPNVIG